MNFLEEQQAPPATLIRLRLDEPSFVIYKAVYPHAEKISGQLMSIVSSLVETCQHKLEQETTSLRHEVMQLVSKANARLQYTKYLRKQAHALLEGYYPSEVIPTIKIMVRGIFKQIEHEFTEAENILAAAKQLLDEFI
jgi:hypothetical protein